RGPGADLDRERATPHPRRLHGQHPAPPAHHDAAGDRRAVPVRGRDVSIPSGGSSLLRLRDEDDGVTLVIVVLTLIAMMGMLVLVVDVGGLLWKRRELVNAPDAAALSAAHTCALKSAVDPKTAKQAADFTALTNVSGTGLSGTVTDSGTCHTGASGWVKVQYSQPQHLFFAPVLGFSNINGVTTKATATCG